MREILFRGKRKNGEWVQGYYILWQGKHCIYDDVVYYEVLPETIGQYTGLTDKNGTKIFEGDILKDVSDVGDKQLYEVFYNKELCAFMFDDQYWITPTRDWLSKGDKNPTTIMLEIVGNIHDNPELLKSEVQGE